MNSGGTPASGYQRAQRTRNDCADAPASHGHVQVVRVLLEHGADPNVRRNDNFTALSLAAFFGHAEIVETLMRHGANAQVATRFGTSPHMWAKARSFGDVARCLRSAPRKDQPRQSKRKPVLPRRPISTESAKPLAAPPVVRTLKEPPEIWDLVQEAPRNFNPRSAFIARVGSLNGGLVVSMIALLVLVGLGAGAWLFLKNSVRASAVPAAPAPAAAPVSAPPAVESPETSNVVAEIPVVVSETVNTVVTTNVPRRSRRLATSRAISDEVNVQSESGESRLRRRSRNAANRFESIECGRDKKISATREFPCDLVFEEHAAEGKSDPMAMTPAWPNDDREIQFFVYLR